MATSFSFIGAYRLASKAEIDEALAELREVLDEGDIPNPFTAREIVIDDTEVRFSITGARPSDWFDYYDTIVETFADRAVSGAVSVTCDGVVEIYEP